MLDRLDLALYVKCSPGHSVLGSGREINKTRYTNGTAFWQRYTGSEPVTPNTAGTQHGRIKTRDIDARLTSTSLPRNLTCQLQITTCENGQHFGRRSHGIHAPRTAYISRYKARKSSIEVVIHPRDAKEVFGHFKPTARSLWCRLRAIFDHRLSQLLSTSHRQLPSHREQLGQQRQLRAIQIDQAIQRHDLDTNHRASILDCCIDQPIEWLWLRRQLLQSDLYGGIARSASLNALPRGAQHASFVPHAARDARHNDGQGHHDPQHSNQDNAAP